MYIFNGSRVMVFEVELDCHFSEPQYAVVTVYVNGDTNPLTPDERRAFVEQNRGALEYLCGLSHTQWLEEKMENANITLH